MFSKYFLSYFTCNLVQMFRKMFHAENVVRRFSGTAHRLKINICAKCFTHPRSMFYSHQFLVNVKKTFVYARDRLEARMRSL